VGVGDAVLTLGSPLGPDACFLLESLNSSRRASCAPLLLVEVHSGGPGADGSVSPVGNGGSIGFASTGRSNSGASICSSGTLTSLVRNMERAADKEKEKKGPRSVRCRGIGRGTRNGENASNRCNIDGGDNSAHSYRRVCRHALAFLSENKGRRYGWLDAWRSRVPCHVRTRPTGVGPRPAAPAAQIVIFTAAKAKRDTPPVVPFAVFSFTSREIPTRLHSTSHPPDTQSRQINI
jgi:hypothetical protein